MVLVPPFPRTTRLRTVIIRMQCRLPLFARVGFAHLVPAMRPGSDSAKLSLTVAVVDSMNVIAPLGDDFFERADPLLRRIVLGLTASFDSTGFDAGGGG